MKRKKAALYDPYLDTMGGGERHVLAIMQVLEQVGYTISIYWNTDLSQEIEKKLDLHFKTKINFETNIFRQHTSHNDKMAALKDVDIFIYVTDGSYFFSSAIHNFIFCMVPDKQLYQMSILNRIKLRNYQYIANSSFTASRLKDWGIRPEIIYPYINDDFILMNVNHIKKEQIILSVGRFFPHLHAKRQDVVIETYKKLVKQNSDYKKYKLVLAGGVKDEDKQYFSELKSRAEGYDSILFYPNISYKELLDLYKKASIYWHFTGYGLNDHAHPEKVEHLGITPLEAMASGCVTFCYNAGGPKEIIQESKTGYLFDNDEDLIYKMKLFNPNQMKEIQKNGKEYVTSHFSYEVFKQQVMNIMKP